MSLENSTITEANNAGEPRDNILHSPRVIRRDNRQRQHEANNAAPAAGGNQVIDLGAALDMFLRGDPSPEVNQSSSSTHLIAGDALGDNVLESANPAQTDIQGQPREDVSPIQQVESDSDQTDPGMPELIPVNQISGEPEHGGQGDGASSPQIRGTGSDRVPALLPMRRLDLGQVL